MTMTEANKDWAERSREIGAGAYASIVEMVEALNCDYDRLTELCDLQGPDMPEDERQELAELAAYADGCTDREDAEQRIQEDALSVRVRSDWVSPGEPMTASQFELLLTTGGPAVRILGELDEYQQPVRAWLEVQDWFLPWTEYVPADQDVLLDYARCFYYGE